MILFRRKGGKTHGSFEHATELYIYFILLISALIVGGLVVSFNTSRIYYGRVDSLSVDKYENPIEYKMRLYFRELEKYKEYEITKEEFDSYSFGQIIEKDIPLSSIGGKGSLLTVFLALSILTQIVAFARVLMLISYWIIDHVFHTYAFIIMSKKRYNSIKEIDPFLEEKW